MCVEGGAAYLTTMSERLAHTFWVITLAIIITCGIKKGGAAPPTTFGGNTVHCHCEMQEGTFKDFYLRVLLCLDLIVHIWGNCTPRETTEAYRGSSCFMFVKCVCLCAYDLFRKVFCETCSYPGKQARCCDLLAHV